ncbi:vitamin B12-dependent ribonucleotide reductase [Candidatus Woesearchaeota archaeon]|nr:vitamin B12-dependent ribonucleotide reductase [Candidatus Woesearchaeota archaeon]MCF7901241.1 vitamin B12-dependent ribonucleotide reductase [Candidatus Woesearchaeota archaeon]MCF8012852.1 vitamin B12-dependent ribonucleotide reductase [Candidatus Woesearchaeota archaeon]
MNIENQQAEKERIEKTINILNDGKYSEKGLEFKRIFTKEDKAPENMFEYDTRKSVIKNPDGSVVFEINNVEVPKFWSQVATDILAQKYFRKRGVPLFDSTGNPVIDSETKKQKIGSEHSIKQVAHRMALTWKNWGLRYGYFKSKNDAQIFYDETIYMIINQMCAPNSPQWFNTGLAEAYNIRGEAQGHYYCDHESGELKKSEDAYTRPQPHACFIQELKDDLVNEGGIFDLLAREARLFKYGSGTGTNFSSLRGSGERLSGGGKSSGLMSFLDIFDKAAGAIKSGGTTRRAAKMISLDLDHPDIIKFIDWKVKEEQKVAALVAGSKITKKHLNKIFKIATEKKSVSIKENVELRKEIKKALINDVPINYIQRTLQLVRQGVKEIDFVELDTNYESEAYQTVSGQNSNNSIRIPNKFFDALTKNDTWKLINRTDGKVSKTIPATDLWDKINYSAWMCADPGVQYDTTINEWHTCPTDGRINGSNPCSEYMFLDDTACNLASLNLIKFYDSTTNTFEVEKFKHGVRIWTIILEISVLMAQFPSKQIAIKSYKYRTLGLGFANIGAMLMMSGHPYNSSQGRAIAGGISSIMGGEAYRTSAEIAACQGPFERYDVNKKSMLKVIRNHRRAAYNSSSETYEELTIKPMGLDEKECPRYLLDAAREAWDDALTLGEKNGFRNAQVTVIAPTGTIGLVMDCDTTGIEPDFALVKFKKLAGGGYFKIVNQSVPKALKNLKYDVDQIKKIIDYAVGTGSLKSSPKINYESLKEKGFPEIKIKEIEAQLNTAFELKFVFNKWSIGEDLLKEMGFSNDQIKDPNLNVLEALGFSKNDILEAEEHICGRMTLEGAPELKDEHIKVFDCANKCGKKGQRYIESDGHLLMMASVQPFISGAISKTINMDKSASIDEVGDVYMDGWKYMIKAVALYRDGSKLSQPLSASNPDETELLMLKEEDMIDESVGPKEIHEVTIRNIEQKKMPSKRGGFVQEASVGGQKVFLRTGEYEDGDLGEIFIDTYKEGASYGALLNCFAIAISKGLQYGVPLSDYVESFTFTRFEPSGIVGGHPAIKNATSIIDYVFRVLGYEYLGRKDFVHVKSMESFDAKGKNGNGVLNNPKKDDKEKQLTITDKDAKVFEAKSKGYTGEQCTSCGSMKLRRNGSCMVCEDCGNTTGCS